MTVYLDEGRSFAGVQSLVVVVVASADVADPTSSVAQRLGCENHVERYRQRATLVISETWV